ncbi:MAG: class I SAM-dependent methyltransferase [Proteobacteria bacterium]|nr:class I SAM-dependent methyltransferase [Pseudomonadota bacterium]
MNDKDNTTPHKAGEFDEKVRKTLPFYDCFYSETIDFVSIAKPDVKVWLDTGCGTGSFVLQALQRFPTTRFLLADPSEGMLAQAKENLSEIPVSQLGWLGSVGSEAIDLAGPEKPEVLTAIQCHHYLDREKRIQATQNCYDLLADGGIYLTFENSRPNTEEGVKYGLERWGAYQLSQGRDEATVEDHIKRFNKAYFPITLDEHLDLLKRCGFRTVELLWFSHMQSGYYAIK